MVRYWLGGENQAFVLLLSQIDKGELRGEQSGEYGSDFSFSFPNRARKLWREVSAPYLKLQDDMEDFVADSDEEEASGPMINPHFTPPSLEDEGGDTKTPEERMIEHLKKRNAARNVQSCSDEGASGGGDDSSDDELEVLPKPSEMEEVEEEDDWTKSKRYDSAKKSRKMKTLVDSDADSDDDEEEPKVPATSGSARKRIDDSSDDE